MVRIQERQTRGNGDLRHTGTVSRASACPACRAGLSPRSTRLRQCWESSPRGRRAAGSYTLLAPFLARPRQPCGEVTEEGERIQLPPDFCGGRVTFAFHAISSVTGEETDGLYEVNCQIHDPGGQAPRGTSEGVKANARGVNFNKHVTGDNLLVKLP